MKKRIIKRKGTLLSSVALLGTAMLLTACGGDGGDSPVDDGGVNPGASGAQALLYAYPDNEQTEVSTAAPVVLRFSSAVNLGEAGNAITLYEGDAETGTAIGFTPEPVSGEPNNVLLEPDQDLKPHQTYTVVIDDLRLGQGTAKDQTLTFTTRPLHEGPKSLVVKDDDFKVSRRMPDGSAMEPVMDFSSFRFQFTQPIDRATASYGDGNTVVLRDSAGDPVDATLLIDGAYMTVDPEPKYLNAGETYTLDITADLASTYGVPFGEQSYPLTPKDSSPGREPAILVQKLTQGTTSRLTGKPVNEVPVNGTLLGENDNITQASADVVRAELADVTTYTDVTPIRLPKGTVLKGAEINPILIGGEVPAGFGSGDVTMTVLSDASGYLVPNPYAGNNPNALRIVHLMMDVGIATSEARANGAFTQDLLHIELVGLAEVDPEAGVLNLDAVSVVEPNILGQEYGYGMLSFQLQSYKDQNDPPQIAKDITSPKLKSWVPGEDASSFKVSDPIILNFDEPIARKEIEDSVRLMENGTQIPASVSVDGSAVIIQPQQMLEPSRQSRTNIDEVNRRIYSIEFTEDLTDLSGNSYDPGTEDFSFELPLIVEMARYVSVRDSGNAAEVPDRSPIVLSAYPGYPCVLDETGLNFSDANNPTVGRCLSGLREPYTSPDPFITASIEIEDSSFERTTKEPDDLLPLPNLPANRPISIQLSKPVAPESVQAGVTFIVTRTSPQAGEPSEVDGDLHVDAGRITFWPKQPWVPGEIYSYRLVSTGDMTNQTQPECFSNQPTAICDVAGLPLQTQLRGTEVVDIENGSGIVENSVEPDAGGPDMVQYFKAVKDSDKVLLALTAPSSDANANFFSEVQLDNFLGQYPQTLYLDQREFTYEEEGAANAIPDTSTCQVAGECLDPQGLLPPPNSTKLFSQELSGVRFEVQGGGSGDPAIEGINIGCGYLADKATPSICPENKFAFLNSAIFAEVGGYNAQKDAIDVQIWPGQVMVSSVPTFAITLAGNVVLGVDSGPQRIRMRYAKDDPSCDDEGLVSSCSRSSPIQAWLSYSEVDKQLQLSATVDAYVDALALEDYLDLRPFITFLWHHELVSVPVKLNLKGSVEFTSDGRMMVDQFNLNDINIEGYIYNETFNNENIWGVGAVIDFVIPKNGTRVQYLSEVVK